MADQPHGYRSLTRKELEELAGAPMSERAAASLLNAGIAVPINAAVAANVLSENSAAFADAAEDGAIEQST